ncbi:tRNA-dihydrouridine(47) synthase [NAD(P)(+)]-like [Ischnura elegans]|uniref:tRNA-dihydrouridine(47) synthase [NAD(P)(+)]-like n=1 Tax=Ischnura elegans TaxID=197161 RepID=UPI001ED88C6E|nr:tRNA-dihydrouridine(47) synthase [NAD(P)(+)]-like [Ischnura elegans]
MDLSDVAKIDRPSGVALIKPKYILQNIANESVPEPVPEDDVPEDNNDGEIMDNDDESPPNKKLKFSRSERKRQRGQNKARPPPMKFNRHDNLCPQLLDLGCNGNQEELKPASCQNGEKCPFQHDIIKFLENKPPDIGAECHVFKTYGLCPRGPTCRFASAHLTPEGKNVIDTERWERTKSLPPVSANILSKDLQLTLRKRKYSFVRSEAILAREKLENDAAKEAKKEGQVMTEVDSSVKVTVPVSVERKGQDNEVKLEENGGGGETGDKAPGVGAVTDEDIIRLCPRERKKLDWRGKLYLSPLTTVGNLPFRRICKQYGADITCGEMALASSLLQGAQAEWALVRRHCSEDFFGVQLCGNNPYVLTRCAQMLEEQTSIDFIDLNLGCPIDLIYQQGGGSGLLRRENTLGIIVRSMTGVLNLPLTVKTRTGVHSDKNVAHTLIPKFKDWGVSAITLHGRSREQRYTRLADWDYINECAKLADPVPLFGNGDILSYEDYERHMEAGAVSGVMIGRGALMKPWIFEEIKEKKMYDISSGERFDILKKYANYGLEHWGSDNKGVETTRRFMLEWLSFLHRYIPIGLLERPPQRINERPPPYCGRNDLETLMASPDCQSWVKLSEMILGPVPEGFHFLPKHKANSWK